MNTNTDIFFIYPTQMKRGLLMLFLDYVPDLQEIDYTIYKYVSTNLDKVSYMRIRDLADATHTSTTSILRFCQKFECSGFSEFRFRLKEFAEKKPPQLASVDESEFIAFFGRSTQPMYNEKVHQAVEILKDKKFVLFIGMGSSNVIAKYGALYFSTIFTFSLHIEDMARHPIHHVPQDFSEGICLIALSMSGETPELIQYIEQFSHGNSTVISLTNSEKSTIAQLSDLNIPYYIEREKIDDSDITTQIPAMYFLERIAREFKRQQT